MVRFKETDMAKQVQKASRSEVEMCNTRDEIEFSEGWARAHPDVFTRRLFDFMAKHRSDDWLIRCDARRIGFLTITAQLKDGLDG